MKVLCMCQYGHNRSVAMAYLLNHDGDNETLAIGWGAHSPALKAYLFAWAERIAVLEQAYLVHVPPEHRHKAFVVEVGPDVYGTPRSPELMRRLKELVRNGAIPGATIR